MLLPVLVAVAQEAARGCVLTKPYIAVDFPAVVSNPMLHKFLKLIKNIIILECVSRRVNLSFWISREWACIASYV